MKAWIVSLMTLATIVVGACTQQGVCDRTKPDGTPNAYDYCAIATPTPVPCTSDNECAALKCRWQPGDQSKGCVASCDDQHACPTGYTCDKDNDSPKNMPEKFCFPDCHGRWVTPDLWESNPIDSHWIPYPAERTIVLHVRDPKTGIEIPYTEVAEIRAYVASATGGYDGTLAGGLLSAVSTSCLEKRQICALNDTCADYFLRVMVQRISTAKDAATE